MRSLLWLGAGVLVLAVPAVFLSPAARNMSMGAVLPFLRGGAAIGAEGTALYNRLIPASAAEKARLATYEHLVHELTLQVLNARNAGEENRELRAYDKLPLPPAWRLVVAPVIARDPLTWNRRFRIGKGSVDGIVPGAAVLAGDVLIGRVMETTASSALVATVADPACRVSVSIPARNAVGVLNGRVGQDQHQTPVCQVTFLPRDISYQKGDAAVTSGLSGNMPAGLPVGQVIAWDDDRVSRVVSSAYAELCIRPAAPFDNFRFAGVVVSPAARERGAVTSKALLPDGN